MSDSKVVSPINFQVWNCRTGSRMVVLMIYQLLRLSILFSFVQLLQELRTRKVPKRKDELFFREGWVTIKRHYVSPPRRWKKFHLQDGRRLIVINLLQLPPALY